MGKFESYEAANALNDDDITLYNQNTVTHKVTFGTLATRMMDKIISIGGLVSSISAGVGLAGGTITSNGTIKCNLKSETPSVLESSSISTVANRQYAVELDANGKLSVNVPWTDNTVTYQSGNGIKIINNAISANVASETFSTLASTAMGSTANRQYAVGLDNNGHLSVNIPWDSGMATDGSNASSDVQFSGALTIGTRPQPSAVGSYSLSQGQICIASGAASHAEGYNTTASGDYSHAEGYGTMTPYSISHAEGRYTLAYEIAHSEGRGNNNITTGDNNPPSDFYRNISRHSISAISNGSHAEGYTANYEGNTAIIQARGQGSHAEGYSDLSNNNIGRYIIAYGYGSHAEGYAHADNIIAHGNGSHAEGDGTNANGHYSHAEGLCTQSLGESSHSEGRYTETLNIGAHSEGYGQKNINTGLSTLPSHFESNASYSISSSSIGSHAEGATIVYNGHTGVIQANGQGSHAEGFADCASNGGIIIASGNGSHAEGLASGGGVIQASGNGSHAEGTNTTASGAYSHAEGTSTTASGVNSHAEGYQTIASGESSHAEGGYNVRASGICSHAEGYNTIASGNYSHSEGYDCEASGYYSHVEGNGCAAIGDYSHAEGYHTSTSGHYSHVEGYENIVNGNYNHVGGYNVQMSGRDYYHSHMIYGGYGTKFTETGQSDTHNYGRGAIGFNPSGQYFTTNATIDIDDSKYGFGGTIKEGVMLDIDLSPYAIYQLFIASYGNSMYSAMYTITTDDAHALVLECKTSSNIPQANVGDYYSRVSIEAVSKTMFHLIRIM